MTTIERIRVELGNTSENFTTEMIEMYLQENNLDPVQEYNKATMQRDLLYTIVDILEATANDIDLMRKITDESTGLSTGDAYKHLQARIADVKKRIQAIPTEDTDAHSNVQLLFTRNGRG